MINTNSIVNAVQRHGTIFLDSDLNPVELKPGQWFCEYDDDLDMGESNFCRDGAIVEYLGPCNNVVWNGKSGDESSFDPYGDPMYRHRVATEYDDGDRRPQGRALILQA